jgi:hypothetical protein
MAIDAHVDASHTDSHADSAITGTRDTPDSHHDITIHKRYKWAH